MYGVLRTSMIAGCLAAVAASAATEPRSLEVAREVERIAADVPLWPGFAPLDIPLAVFDGEATYLFRHPRPPEGFVAVAGATPAAYRFAGRHPAVASNTSAEIGGVMSATLMADGAARELPARELAAVALHEAFHVFQRAHHPTWIGNEGDLLLYPFADRRLLISRRQETEGLRRALAAEEPVRAACWTRTALDARRQRFAAMDARFVAYERGSELNEGLAEYVEVRAAGRSTVAFPDHGFPAEALRDRFYTVGPALALLLDRLAPGWQASLDADDAQHLDGLLGAAAAEAPDTDPGACTLTFAERASIDRRAAADAAAVSRRRVDRERTFWAIPGWRLVIETAPGHPLWPQGFDPLNVQRLPAGLLHSRFVRLGNDQGSVEMLDGDAADLEAITEAAGDHPLFNGVARVTFVGLSEPMVEQDGDAVRVEAPGIRARFEGAALGSRLDEVIVRLGESR